jgi:hypothetical protein
LSNCFWHKVKDLPIKFNYDIAEKKVTLSKSEQRGNKKQAFKYPDLREVGLTRKKIKNHFYRSQALFPGDSVEMRAEFCNLADFYQELSDNTLSEISINELKNWLEKNSQDFDKYCLGLKTDLEESFHRVALKYWKKGSTYSYEEYITRRAFAFLNWNENQGKESNSSFFQKNIADTFHQFMLQRIKAKGAKTNYYLPKTYGMTDNYKTVLS